MKYISVLFFSMLMVLSAGCATGKSVGCTIEQTVVEKVGPAIALGLECSNEAAIEVDLEAVIGKLGVCSESNKPKLWGPICSMVADSVVNGVAAFAIPSSWGCKANNAKGLLKNVILTGCSQI